MVTVSGWANLLGGGGSSSITAHYLTEFIVTRIMGQFWPYILVLSILDVYLIMFNYEPSLLFHFDFQYSLFCVATHQL